MAFQQHTDLYNLLNVRCDASIPEIKKSYKKLAREFHPDKNPSTGDKFKDISFAHEVLTDPDKRSIYDKYGMNGLQKGTREEPTSHFGNLFPDFFSFGDSFFELDRGMPGGRFSNLFNRRHVEDSIFPLKVTLEDLFNGKMARFSMNKNVICVRCKGTGSKSGLRQICPRCFGSGIGINNSLHMFFHQVHTTCHACKGEGTIIPDSERCDHCRGNKTCVERTRLEVYVEKGMKSSQKLVLHGQGNQYPEMPAGNVLVILQEEEHETFTRNGNDLHVVKNITLTEALCGFSFGLNHLDGRVLRIVQPAGQCITNGHVKGIPNEGMPCHSIPTYRGYLFVKFNVTFPANYFANENQLKLLETILGPRPAFTMPTGDDTEEVDLLDYPLHEEKAKTSSSEAYNQDEDDSYDHYVPGGGVQCAQQ